MDFQLLELLGFGGTGLAFTLAVLGLFWKGDDAFSDQLKRDLSDWLQGLKIAGAPIEPPTAFAAIFDRIFGEHHFTMSCFMRACLMSTTFYFLLVSCAWLFGEGLEWRVFIGLFIIFGIPLNWVGDYLSLLKTRWLLSKLIERSIVIYSLLYRDIMWNLLIIATFIGVGLGILRALDYAGLLGFIEMLTGPLREPRPFKPLHFLGISQIDSFGWFLIFVWLTTFFTSIWIWLTLLSWTILRVGARAQPILRFMQYALPISDRPIRSIGIVAALVTALTFILAALLEAVFG